MSRPPAAALENFNPAPTDLPALALSNHVYNDLTPRNFASGAANAELPDTLDFSPEIYPSESIDQLPAATAEQLRPIFDKATGVNFTSAADNAKSGEQPDFYLGEDGKLRANPNKKEPNKDGSINIELQTKNKNETDALKFADQLQKAAIKDLVNYFAQNNPGAKIPQHWLDMLQKEPDLPPAPVPISLDQPTAPDVPAPQPDRPQPQQPQPSDHGGSSGGGGGGSSGGGGGGGGDGGGYSGGGGGGDSGIARPTDGSTGPDVNLNEASPRLMQIMDFFVEKGLTPEQAAGIAGNLQYESGLDPGIEEHGNGIGYGIAQWSFGRRDQLNDFAASEGKPVSDLGVQLDFLWKELNTTESATLDAFKANPNMSAAEASDVFYDKFERPAFNAENRNNRSETAEQFLAQYENGGSNGAYAAAPAAGEEGQAIVNAASGDVGQQLWAKTEWAGVCEGGNLGCAASVSYVLREAGLLGQGEGSAGVDNLAAELVDKGWTEVPLSQAQAGDVMYNSHHIGISAGGDMVFDNSSGSTVWEHREMANSGLSDGEKTVLRPPTGTA